MDRKLPVQWIGRFHAVLRRLRAVLLLALLAPAFLSCTFFEKNKLQAVIAAGELVVLTRTSPTTYYETPEGPAGFEYDLVKGFADYLGVNPRFIVVPKFSDILPQIAAMDADVITIETSRSNMALLESFGVFKYPNAIGPGIYDIHSPRVPETDALVRLLERAGEVVPLERLWVNPDCGLKTRNWSETEAALRNMVEAAGRLRARISSATPEEIKT